MRFLESTGFLSVRFKRLQYCILFCIIFGAFWIRFYKIDEVPAGFYCDEASIGYNAFALGGWGIDQNGCHWPLYIKSVGAYQNPIFVYTAIVPIQLFGLTERSVRLTSVFYGTLLVAGTAWLSFELWGLASGIWAAFFVAITPWCFHFSRIAFELISFPALFTLGLAALLRGIYKNKYFLLPAAIFLGLTIYTYIMAATFLPFIFIFCAIFYFKRLLKSKRITFLAVVLLLLLILPAIGFRLNQPNNAHFRNSSWIDDLPKTHIIDFSVKFWSQYRQFCSYAYLFEKGDRAPRHSIKNHGELYKSYIPFLVLGLVMLLIKPRREHFLLIIWVLTFPVGAALTRDVYATRSIIGSPLAPLITSFAIISIYGWINQIKWVFTRWCLLVLITGLSIYFPGYQAIQYFHEYFSKYNEYSAGSIYGFQYGYKEIISYMENNKAKYEQRILTATDVNNPPVFINFYTRTDPSYWAKKHQLDYLICKPAEYSKYTLEKSTVYSVRPKELFYFEEYDVLKSITAPNNSVEFEIIHPKKRKNFVTEWSTRGLYPFPRNSEFNLVYPDPQNTYLKKDTGLQDEIFWKKLNVQFVSLDFQRDYINSDPRHPGNPENCYMDGVSYLNFKKSDTGFIEVTGPKDLLVIWLNGIQLTDVFRTDYLPNKIPVEWQKGWNEICFRSFEESGEWYIGICAEDSDGFTYPDLVQRFDPPSF